MTMMTAEVGADLARLAHERKWDELAPPAELAALAAARSAIASRRRSCRVVGRRRPLRPDRLACERDCRFELFRECDRRRPGRRRTDPPCFVLSFGHEQPQFLM